MGVGLVNAEAVLERLRTDTPFYARNCLKIINKDSELVPFEMNAGQLELNRLIEDQRAAGKPMRALALKARQVGISTFSQAKLIQRTTLFGNQNAVVVAHDTKTGNLLYRIGQTMYANLPSEVQPPHRSHRQGRFLHFAPPGRDAMISAEAWPNSTYQVDTAGEFEGGRGGTYQLAHLSEFAFWERPLEKLTALMQGVPRSNPNSLVIIESTANGMNLFRDLWQDAEAGKSGYVPFFWPWWKDETYALAFANDAEREHFVKQIGTGEWGEDEPRLIQMFKGAGMSEDEQQRRLHWRRMTIGTECAGKLSKFHQEYPSTPEEAFVTSGRQVFDPELVKGILVSCEITDPRVPDKEHPGPALGTFEGADIQTRLGRMGELQVPTRGVWVPRESAGQRDLWRLWRPEVKPEEQYVIGVDVSGGDQSEEQSQPAFHAVQVIDHKTRVQVAEYRSHVDSLILAEQVYLAALFFNDAWVAVEITGGWGLPVINRIFKDYHYPYIYSRRAHEMSHESQSKMIGWHTTVKTKPILEANAAEIIRDEPGIYSRALASEMLSYVRDEKGRTGPESGRFSDLVIAWMIAEQVANELPIRVAAKKGRRPVASGYSADPVTGY